jgi:hypothetical protein
MKFQITIALSVALILSTTHRLSATEVEDFGLQGVELMDDDSATAIRGAGFSSTESVGMSSMQIFLFDSNGGSSVNLSSSSVNHATDVHQLSEGDDSFQVVVSTSESGVSLDEMDIYIGDFWFGTTDINLNAFGAGTAYGSPLDVYIAD